MRSLGVNAYRFSISWSRGLPEGREDQQEGFKLQQQPSRCTHRIWDAPFITLYHFDPPSETTKRGEWLAQVGNSQKL
ncbi:MAG: family 1 glycosylhydrolase [Candidatus Bathyarchaeia archaeon]